MDVCAEKGLLGNIRRKPVTGHFLKNVRDGKCGCSSGGFTEASVFFFLNVCLVPQKQDRKAPEMNYEQRTSTSNVSFSESVDSR